MIAALLTALSLAVFVGVLILPWIAALVHASRTSDAAWARTGRSRTAWVLVLTIAGAMGGGILAALVYYLTAHRALERARRAIAVYPFA